MPQDRRASFLPTFAGSTGLLLATLACGSGAEGEGAATGGVGGAAIGALGGAAGTAAGGMTQVGQAGYISFVSQ